MTAKQYLNQIHYAELKIVELQEEIEELRALVTSTVVENNSDRVKSSGSQDKMADVVCLIADKTRDLQEQIKALINTRTDVMETIEKVDNADYEQVLYKRYCQNKTWEQIAMEKHYSLRWTYILHGRALQAVERILNSAL